MKNTQVINFFAGPGTGKSTLAAHTFAELKNQGKDVELVREYVKDWAYLNRRPKATDQLYLLGKQSQAESRLYGKVDYIVTDSPILLAPMYEKNYFNRDVTESAAFRFLQYAKEDGIIHHNFFLKRYKAFKQIGRFETEEQAKALDKFFETYLKMHEVSYTVVDLPFEKRLDFILNNIKERTNV